MIVRDEYLGWVMEGKILKKWVSILSVMFYLYIGNKLNGKPSAVTVLLTTMVLRLTI